MEELRHQIRLKLQNHATAHHDIVEEINSDEVERLIPAILYLSLIIITGIPGNGLVCYIYQSKYAMSSSKWFIFFLACVDLIFCSLIIPTELVLMFHQFTFSNTILCKVNTFVNLWSLLTLGFTLVIVSIDRYRKVCRPLGWQINFNKARALCGVGVVISLVIALPANYIYDIHKLEFYVKGHNVTLSNCSFRTSAWDSSFAFFYIVFGMVIFTCALGTICILYAFIGKEIKQHIRKHNIRRKLSLSASMAQLHHSHLKSVSYKVEQDSVNFNGDTLPRKTVRFQRSHERSSTIIDGDDVSISNIHNTDEEVACDSENSVAPKHQRKAPKIKSRKMRKATFSMFLISIAFVLSYLPFLALLFLKSVIKDFDENLSEGGRAVYKFFIRSYFFNCAVNPFIYGISDSQFRENCRDVVSRLCRRFKKMCCCKC